MCQRRIAGRPVGLDLPEPSSECVRAGAQQGALGVSAFGDGSYAAGVRPDGLRFVGLIVPNFCDAMANRPRPLPRATGPPRATRQPTTVGRQLSSIHATLPCVAAFAAMHGRVPGSEAGEREQVQGNAISRSEITSPA